MTKRVLFYRTEIFITLIVFEVLCKREASLLGLGDSKVCFDPKSEVRKWRVDTPSKVQKRRQIKYLVRLLFVKFDRNDLAVSFPSFTASIIP